MRPVVLDTNVVLDLMVFRDPRTAMLRSALEQRELQWLATVAMRDELVQVLAYPNLAARAGDAGRVLDAFDAAVRRVPVADCAPVHCRDTDDQKFIDLAVACQGLLLSKDNEVLRLKKRLASLHVETRAIYA